MAVSKAKPPTVCPHSNKHAAHNNTTHHIAVHEITSHHSAAQQSPQQHSIAGWGSPHLQVLQCLWRCAEVLDPQMQDPILCPAAISHRPLLQPPVETNCCVQHGELQDRAGGSSSSSSSSCTYQSTNVTSNAITSDILVADFLPATKPHYFGTATNRLIHLCPRISASCQSSHLHWLTPPPGMLPSTLLMSRIADKPPAAVHCVSSHCRYLAQPFGPTLGLVVLAARQE
jgi:hypothetical protein